ncbi:MAG: phosphatidate cytidylyltransferase [Desulfobacteraceae bacterium]|nr:phosphatidate cytidylyltransferase [Desulfobacteraceae bacterium]
MHLKRWITGIIAVPIIFAIINYGGKALISLLIWGAGLIGVYEYLTFTFKPCHHLAKRWFSGLTYVSASLIILSAYFSNIDYLLTIITGNFVICGLMGVILFKYEPAATDMIPRQLMGVVYIPTSLSFLILIYNTPHGISWIFYILCLVALGDTVALYVGSYFGKHKLWPAASPKKTIEGAVGGICGSIAIGLIFKVLFLNTLSVADALVFSILVGMAGQAGDLFESILKRSAGIKDSGTILPGHGGMLDRIDALLFATPLAYFLLGHIL